MKTYATWFINLVEYQTGYYTWTKRDRAKVSEKDLAGMLNKAYATGYLQATKEVAQVVTDMQGQVRVNSEDHK